MSCESILRDVDKFYHMIYFIIWVWSFHKSKASPSQGQATSQAQATNDVIVIIFFHFLSFMSTAKQFYRCHSAWRVLWQILNAWLHTHEVLECICKMLHYYFSTSRQFLRCVVKMEPMPLLCLLNRGQNPWGRLMGIEVCIEQLRRDMSMGSGVSRWPEQMWRRLQRDWIWKYPTDEPSCYLGLPVVHSNNNVMVAWSSEDG